MQTPRVNDLPAETVVDVRLRGTLDSFTMTAKDIRDEGFGWLRLHLNVPVVLVELETYVCLETADMA